MMCCKVKSNLCNVKLASAEGICGSLESLQVSPNNCPGSPWFSAL